LEIIFRGFVTNNIQNLDPQFPLTGKTEKKKTFLPCFAKSPTDILISMLLSLKISKYKIGSFNTPVFGSIFLFLVILLAAIPFL